MLARLERYLYALTAMLVLWVVVVAVTPAMAQAQQAAPPKDTKDTNPNTAERIVVSPGDSLWSISEEQLGPKATPRQIATSVERIYALNQDRIGSDPNLIFPGQKLSLPAVSEMSRAKDSAGADPAGADPAGADSAGADSAGAAPPTPGATKPPEASTREPRPEKALKASGTPRDKEAKPVALPNMPTKQPAPKVGSPTATDAPSPIESFVRSARSLFSSATSSVVGLFPQDDHLLLGSRKLLGLVIIAITLLLASLIAWKLPLRRNVGGFEVVGRLPRGYAGAHTYPNEAPDRYSSTPRRAPPIDEPDAGSFGGEAPPGKNDINDGAAGIIVATQRRRHRVLREQEQDSGRSPHRGLATGAHNPQVTRHLRRARTSTPAWSGTRRPQLHRRRSLSPKGGRL